MKLRTQLILAFFLLAVVPLAGVSLYSYYSSIRAFRQAVEAESGSLAEDMGRRMESVKTDLSRQVERLGRFPFSRLITTQTKELNVENHPLFAQFMSEMGEAEGLIESVEFLRSEVKAPQPPQEPAVRSASKSHSEPELVPDGLVIHLSPDSTEAPEIKGQELQPPKPDAVMMHIQPRIVKPAEDKAEQAERAKSRRSEGRARRIAAYEVIMKKMQQAATAAAPAAEIAETIERAAIDAIKDSRQLRQSPLGQDFGSEVTMEGKPVGTVRARISSRQVFRDILRLTNREQGDIPFAVDAEGNLHTISEEDQSKLEELSLELTSGQVHSKAEAAALDDWVVVTREDPKSSLTFGIARPVGEALAEIRNTAVQNLGWGLGMVGLALVGILPLSRRMTRNLSVLSEGAERLAQGDLGARVPVHSRDEFGQLAMTFNRMAQDLKENQKRIVEQERLNKELEMCRRIQEELLPRQSLLSESVEIKGVSIPAREVGGDFFNYFPLPNGNVALLVGDVSGKGIAAALLMANLQARLQARIPLQEDLSQLAAELDLEISTSTPPEVYLTLFLCILDVHKNVMRYVNAGHQTQFVLRGAGEVESLESSGRPLGLLPGGGYAESRVDLRKGDSLFLYTDGLVDSENPSGEEFGIRKLESLLVTERNTGLEGILARVEEETRKHRGEIEAADDATMVVLKFDGNPQLQ